MKLGTILLIASIALTLSNCSEKGPVPIHYGSDQCANCRMNIVDNRFGCETMTKTNKAFKFDSIECMAAFKDKMDAADGVVAMMWVTDFNKPETFISLANATLIRTKGLRSPMGLGFVGTASSSEAQQFLSAYGGDILNWQQVVAIVNDSWSNGH